jgi:5'-nucleotidase
MTILVDQDGVIADFEAGFYDEWQRKFPHFEATRPRMRFELSEVFPAEYHDDVGAIYRAPGFFAGLPPVQGAKEALEELLALGHDVRICTSPLKRNPACIAEKCEWIQRHFGPAFLDRMVVTKDKTVVHGDVLIDDRPEVHGVRTPSWEHVLYDRSYNADVVGKRRLTWLDWKEVLFGAAEGLAESKRRALSAV